MRLPRLSRRQQAALAVALALLLWMPQGISTHDHTVVTGHSTFYNGETYDQCLASIAGIIRSRVMWFNDMVLAERYGGKGTFIYVTENGARDPAERNYLYTEGVYYDFVDPNGAHWHVEEAFYSRQIHAEANVTDPGELSPRDPNVAANARAMREEDRTYVWFVELSATPIYDQFAGNDPHSLYNFLLLVDTCKMKNAYHANVTHDTTDELSTANGHPAGAEAHEHETHLANIWIGKRPVLVPVTSAGMSGSSWQSSWTSYPEATASSANVTEQTNDGPNNQAND